jgi:DNA-binding winged helix-turn-helix (wHTH) protein
VTGVIYRFGAFTVCTARRALIHEGDELPIIPRYFDLLVLLLERRQQAVGRREILDRVWSDVVVSDGALNQAVRTLRRLLDDDPRQPCFIRTVSRHGYRFVYPDVSVSTAADRETGRREGAAGTREVAAVGDGDAFETALERLLRSDGGIDRETDELERIEAAQRLHELGTAETLRRLDRRPGHERGRAFLREARWDVAGAGPVPLLGRPGALRAARLLLWLRVRRLLRLASARWIGAMLGGAGAGAGAGLIGGLVLRFGPGSSADGGTALLLALIGLTIGWLGAAGVGLGIALAESAARSQRGLALVLLGACGGGTVGAAAHALGLLALAGLFGRDLSPVAGGFEGLVLGGAVGLGYHLATLGVSDGLAAPRGVRRLAAALLAGLCGGLAAVGLASTGSYLGAMSLDLIAESFPGSQVGLGPLARLLGEAEPGPLTTRVISAWEGLMFGFGTVLGLTRRPLGPGEEPERPGGRASAGASEG